MIVKSIFIRKLNLYEGFLSVIKMVDEVENWKTTFQNKIDFSQNNFLKGYRIQRFLKNS